MDWNNLVSWQHNTGYNAANNFPMIPTNFQSTHNPTQQFQHPAINYIHDADPSRPHPNQVHATRDATTGHYFPTCTATWTSCGSTGSSSESLAYTLA